MTVAGAGNNFYCIKCKSRGKEDSICFLMRKGESVMSNAVRNHKDNVFCLLYRDKKKLLSREVRKEFGI